MPGADRSGQLQATGGAAAFGNRPRSFAGGECPWPRGVDGDGASSSQFGSPNCAFVQACLCRDGRRVCDRPSCIGAGTDPADSSAALGGGAGLKPHLQAGPTLLSFAECFRGAFARRPLGTVRGGTFHHCGPKFSGGDQCFHHHPHVYGRG